MEIPSLNPHIRHARAYTDFPIRSLESRCYDCRLFFFREGSGYVNVENEKYDFSSGTVLFLPAGTRYRFYMSEGKADYLIFNFDLVSDFSHLKNSLGTAHPDLFEVEKMPIYPMPPEFSRPIVQAAPQLFETLGKCAQDFLLKPPYYRDVCSARLKRCLLELLLVEEAMPTAAVVRQITDYVHEHYADPQLTNEKIAELFHYHPYYISDLMKQSTGDTLHRYLLRYRLRVARNLLVTSDMDIATVAWKCGFGSAAYFIKTFRADTGLTPAKYRKKNMENF